MTKRDLLKDCISIAHDTGKFGDYVFVYISPHVDCVDFRIHLEGWEIKGKMLIYIFQFTKKQGYKD